MKKISIFSTIVMVLLLLSGCNKGGDNTAVVNKGAAPTPAVAKGPVFKTLTPVAAQQLIKERPDLLLIDVRNKQELSQGAIANSQLVPFWYVAKDKYKLPTNRPILLICAVGGRSYAAAQILSRRGYPEIYNLKGGISAWKQAGLPLRYQ